MTAHGGAAERFVDKNGQAAFHGNSSIREYIN